MRIEHITRLDRFLELQSEWNALKPASGPLSAALTHEWFSAWLKAFGKESELTTLALFEGDTRGAEGERLVGVAPLRIVRSTYRGIRCNQLKFLYNRHGPRCSFLMRDGYGGHTGVLMEEALKLPKWDIAIFENVPREGYLHGVCERMQHSRERSVLLRKTMGSPFLRIEGTWDDFLNSRPRNLKRSLRSKEKKLQAAGTMTIEHLADAASAVSAMPTLCAVGEKSWKARDGRAIGSQPESRKFYSLLADTFGKKNQVSVWLMRINGKPAAFEFHLVNETRVQALRAEFDEEYRDLGVGSILDKEIVKKLFEAGFEEYDMGGEADFYKLRWTDSVRDHFEFLVFGRSAVGRLLCAVEKGLVEPIKKVVNP